MTLAEMIKKATAGLGDPDVALQCAEFMRFRLKLNYQQSFEVVHKVNPDITIAEWDQLLREAEGG